MKTLLATVSLALATWVYAASLPAPDAALIEDAGIPIHADATFVYGDSSVGFRFATATPVAEVRSWYAEQLGDWTLTESFGLWAIYDGPEGLGFGERMSVNQVTVDTNDDMPGWYSIDADMTTEIVIQIGK